MALQTLNCRGGEEGPHLWTRTASRGKPPHYCPLHTEVGKRAPKPAPMPENAPDLPTPEIPEAEAEQDPKNLRHKNYGRLAAIMRCTTRQIPAYLPGPAGSGKTTAGKQIAADLGLPFFAESCNPGMSAWDLMGFMSASGQYVPGICREAVENGGVLLLDEMDAATPDTLVSINLLAASDYGDVIRFRDGALIPLHPNFRLIGAGNTKGDGASEQYVGREQLDAATLDRFQFVEWDYDERLELAFTPHREWTEFVQKVRRIVREQNLPAVVTPRASENGGHLLLAGVSRSHVEQSALWHKMDADTVRAIKHALKAA